MGFTHVPVLLEEVSDSLVSNGTSLFVDATIGGAGHSYAMLERYADLRLIGVDVDEDNLRTAEERLERIQRKGNAGERELQGPEELFYALLTLSPWMAPSLTSGFSTYQMMGDRGFSFNDESFLDMRMDNRSPVTAYDVVNGYGYEALKKVIEELGEEYRAPRIARMIVEERKKKPITTAIGVANVVLKAKKRQGRTHPATKTFQALRIEVNQELDNIKIGVNDAIDMLAPKGGSASYPSILSRTGS